MALAAWRVSTKTRAADANLMRKVRMTTVLLVGSPEVPLSSGLPKTDRRARIRYAEKVEELSSSLFGTPPCSSMRDDGGVGASKAEIE